MLRAIMTVILVALSGYVFGQTYPSKSIKLVVPFPPGGVADIIARPLAESLTTHLGQPVVVDNKGGATGTIGASMVANAPADGYTLLLGTANEITMSPTLFKSLPYDPNAAFTPITPVADFPNVLVVGPSVTSKNFNEFLELIRSKPGRVTFASSGTGSTNHLTTVLFASQVKLDIINVPYRGGGPAIADLLGGQVDAMFATLPSAMSQIKAGKLRALAVTGGIRSFALPDVPTIKELGINGVVVTTWNGVLAPAKLPPKITKQLHDAILHVVDDPNFREKMMAVGVEPISTTPAEFATRIRSDYERWSTLIRRNGVTVE
ncbi:tripartite tricarboxylate transporter substrate binding protein [Polynucleobacter sp. AP-Feld-500C-C5]|uniref:Bug family tripartite tricarboxylate transporter substrate binding protein n=1 Tax=Polynucleobacter sp. AP-Feld-500C-C5 TaxID=2576924 RepID=UPI001C0D276C|nr:tripartite tricarboxylate transporter substrate binding protein [Polynucleobacter sp. AP-Feld-500C-C5]MBU3631877.1 tripartite tricarboxylate transporter substrate binding protein [Polynucleobacter sp. AP-Feld-500C-C5]